MTQLETVYQVATYSENNTGSLLVFNDGVNNELEKMRHTYKNFKLCGVSVLETTELNYQTRQRVWHATISFSYDKWIVYPDPVEQNNPDKP